jgi:hypothetical protein
MFSRRVVPHTYEEFARAILPEIKRSVAAKTGRGFAKHLEVLNRADPRAYYDYSFQTVEYSDNGRLLDRFLSLPVPVHFVHGSVNRGLTYLPRLRASRCTVTEVPEAVISCSTTPRRRSPIACDAPPSPATVPNG